MHIAAFLLIMFDDPLYIFNIFWPSFFFTTLNNVFTTAYFIFMLLYWIVVFEKAKYGLSSKSLTIKKVLFFSFFGVIIFMGLSYTMIELKLSPTSEFSAYDSYFVLGMAISTLIFCMMYLLYMIFVLSNICHKCQRIPHRERIMSAINIVGMVLTLLVVVLFYMRPWNTDCTIIIRWDVHIFPVVL